MDLPKAFQISDQHEKKYTPLSEKEQLRHTQPELNQAVDQDIAEESLALDGPAGPPDAKLNGQNKSQEQISKGKHQSVISEFQPGDPGHELKLNPKHEPPQLVGRHLAPPIKLEDNQYDQSGKHSEEISKSRTPIPSTAVQKMSRSSNQLPISAPNSPGAASNHFPTTSSASTTPFRIQDLEFLVSGTPSDGPRTTNVCPALREILRQAASKWDEETTVAAIYPWFGSEETTHCANTRAFGTDVMNKTACLRCCYAKIPCVLTLPGRRPVVLPLAAPMPGATSCKMGYYVCDGWTSWTRHR